MEIAGAVNGVPTVGTTADGSDETIDIADAGAPSTLNVKTDGRPWDTDDVSSRVAIIGGTTPGRDHFPAPMYATTPGTALPNTVTGYPIGLDPYEYCKMFYAVKKWTLEIDVSWTNGFGSFSGGVSLDWEPKIAPGGGGVTLLGGEYDVVFERQLEWNWNVDDGYSEDGPEITNRTDTGDAFYGWAVEHAYCGPAFYDELLFWKISLFVSADGEFFCRTDTGSESRDVGSLSFWDFGDITLFAEELSGGFGITSCTATLEPAEYWPYANSEGEPVYDPGTGAQLIDPLS